MKFLVTTAEMRAMEAAAATAGVTYAAMMQSAGASVATEIQKRLRVSGLRVVVLAGPGNNGGDGLVVARILREAGAETTVVLVRARGTGDPLTRACVEAGCTLLVWGDDVTEVDVMAALAGADVVVDALLGTGASQPVTGSVASLLACLRETRKIGCPSNQLLVAVDMPSGMNADTGAVDPVTPSVNLTVTFGFAKRGHFAFPGAGRCGELVITDIGLPADLSVQPAAALIDSGDVRSTLPRRPADANKGDSGKALIIAGCATYPGAPILAARAAGRAGAGLVTLACGASLIPTCAGASPETTFAPLPEDVPGYVGESAIGYALAAAHRATAVLIGCGLGRHAATRVLVKAVVEGLQRPYVVDADGLNALAEAPKWWTVLPPGGVLTPHPGEMARLTGMTVEEVQRDRFGVASHCAARWGQTVVLKGAYTIVAAPDGHLLVNPFANPALATAGTGDVLAGILVGLLGTGMAPADAAMAATYVHGLAADLWCRENGGQGLIAQDLIHRLPAALHAILDR